MRSSTWPPPTVPVFHAAPRLQRRARGLLLLVALGLLTAPGVEAGGAPTALAAPGLQDELEVDGTADDETAIAPPFAEGLLRNDAFLSIDEATQADLTEADARFAEAGDDAAARALGQGFEALARVAGRIAVTPPQSLAAVPVDPAAEGTPALVEGQEDALLRRIASLTAEQRDAWRERFGQAAEFAGQRADVAWPGTQAAAGAALRQLDAALEAGQLEFAAAQLERSQRLLALLDSRPGASALQEALRARRGVLAAWDVASTSPAWSRARSLELRGSILLRDREQRVVPLHAGPGLGVRPGLVCPDPRTLLVQTPSALWEVRLDSEGRPQRARPLALDALLEDAFGPMPRPRTGTEPLGWPLQPLLLSSSAEALELAIVHGARAGGRDGTPNALVRIRIPMGPGAQSNVPGVGGLLTEVPGSAPGQATALWALSGDFLWRPGLEPGGSIERLEALAPLGEFEWQPGTTLVDGMLIAQARPVEERTEAWLVALDPDSGRPRWTRRLGEGAALPESQGRFAAALPPRAAAPPLVAAKGRVLTGTQLGLQAAVEARSGLLHWIRPTRRREPGTPGWALSGPYVAASGPRSTAAGGSATALLAPADSDRLYPFTLGPLQSPPQEPTESNPSGTPRATSGAILGLETAEALLGASGDTPLVLRRDGRERTLALLGPPGSRPLDAFHLGPEERFRGRALADAERVLAASDRALYLLDARRQLALLDVSPLDPRGQLPGGDVWDADPWVVVLGFDALWVVAAEE